MSFPTGVPIKGTNNIDWIEADEQASAPSTPSTGKSILYPNAVGVWVARNDGGIGFSMGGPSFSAYASADQTVTAGVLTEVTWNTEWFDTNNWFNTSTGRFTPQIPGRYWFTATAGFSGAASGFNSVLIYKNGSTSQYQIQSVIGSGVSVGLTVAGIVECNGTTDYVSVFAFSQSTNIIKSFIRASFTGVLVRATI